MAEGSYEDECMRAELLGVDKPDYEEFMRKKKEREGAAEEDLDVENLKEAESQSEELQATAGKLEELNSILAATQKKIDRFKFRCGSVTELIKTKIGSMAGTTEQAAEPPPPPPAATEETSEEVASEAEDAAAGVEPGTAAPRKSDLTKALDNHVDRLDSMLDKAESAESNMKQQTGRMRRLLK